jgi:hypothetical protein
MRDDEDITQQEDVQSHPEGSRSRKIAAVVIVIFLLTAGLSIVLYTFVLQEQIDECSWAIEGSALSVTGLFGPVQTTSPTTVTVEFGKITCDPSPTKIVIILNKDGSWSHYEFPNSTNGVTLNLKSGDNVGTITYIDHQDNKRINTGDELSITGLAPGTTYTVIMYWGPTGDQIDARDFETPSD